MTAWADNEQGPACVCGELTTVKILPDGHAILMCLFHTKEAGAVMRLPAEKPECFQPCDPDCDAGPVHCLWAHQPGHKPGRHPQDACPVWACA